MYPRVQNRADAQKCFFGKVSHVFRNPTKHANAEPDGEHAISSRPAAVAEFDPIPVHPSTRHTRMGGTALAQGAGAWATGAAGTLVAVARADGAVDAFHALTAARAPAIAPLPPRGGRPTALALGDGVVAAGTEAGFVVVNGEVVAVLEGGRVAGVACCDRGVVAVGGGAKEVLVIKSGESVARASLAKEHRGPLSAMAAAAAGSRVVVCSQNITLVDTVSGKTLRKYSGHPSPVSAVCMFPGDQRFVTGCSGDQFLFVWDASLEGPVELPASSSASATKSKKRRKTATFGALNTLIAPQSGVRALCVDAREVGSVSCAAILASGAVAVWRNWAEKGASSPTKATFIVHPSPMNSVLAPPPVFTVAFPEVGVLSIVYGTSLKPEVHAIRLHATDKEELALPALAPGGLLAAKSGKDGKPRKTPTGLVTAVGNLAALDAGVPEASKASAAPVSKKTKKAKSAVTEDADADMEDQGDSDASEEDEEEMEGEDGAEPTLQQKLAALGVGRDRAAQGGDTDALQSRVANFGTSGKGLDSRAKVIEQAIRSKDSNLFDTTIDGNMPRKSIVATVQRIPSDVAAGPLLDMLVLRLTQSPGRAGSLLPWVKEIVTEHAGALISRPGNKALKSLMDVVTTRTQTLDALTRLEGRLELVVAQANRISTRKHAGLAQAEPGVEYVEGVGEQDAVSDDESDSDSDEDDSGEEDETGDFTNSGESSEMEDSDEDDADIEMSNADAGETNGLSRKHGTPNGKTANGAESSSSDDGDDAD